MTMLRDSTARTRELGAELRKVREAARYTAKELSMKLNWSPSRISRMETCDRHTSELDAAIYAAFCGATGGTLERVLDLARKADDHYWLHPRGERLPDELRSLIALEATAQLVVYYEPLVIPGMLQTEDYARALFREGDLVPEEGIELRVQIRMERQRLLRRPDAPAVRFFVHENALRMPVGDNRLMHEQMLHLLLLCTASHLQIRVVPAEVGARPGACGPFTWFADPDCNPVIYTEHLTTSLFLEAGGDRLAYQQRLDRLTTLALNEGQSREYSLPSWQATTTEMKASPVIWRKSSYSGAGNGACVEVAWRKSSFSGGGNGACVEVAWRKSSYSGAGNGGCVEVAWPDPRVAVRDSKNQSGPILTFPQGAWSASLSSLAVW